MVLQPIIQYSCLNPQILVEDYLIYVYIYNKQQKTKRTSSLL